MEIWKDISGYEKYEVSNFGKVRSRARKCVDTWGRECFRKTKILSPASDHKGYMFVVLYDKNQNTKAIKIHRLVAEAFIPNPNEYQQINHIDGNKKNNNKSNLEWCTGSQNIRHAYENGLMHAVKGEKHHKATLTDRQVEWIRKYCIKGDRELGTKALGRKFCVANITISRIINGLSRIS